MRRTLLLVLRVRGYLWDGRGQDDPVERGGVGLLRLPFLLPFFNGTGPRLRPAVRRRANRGVVPIGAQHLPRRPILEPDEHLLLPASPKSPLALPRCRLA